MSKRCTFKGVAGILLLLAMGPLAATALSIKHVELLSDTIDFEKNHSATVQFVLTDSAQVQLKIYDARNYLVFHSAPQNYDEGTHQISWDGRANNGDRVPPEAYVFTLVADRHGEVVEHDLTDHTGAGRLPAIEAKWLPSEGEVAFTLPKDARVNLRVGLENGPLLINLLDWVPRRAGSYRMAWDGYDRNKTINLSKHPQLRMVADAFTLPSNTLYVLPETDHPQYMTSLNEARVEQRQPKKTVQQLQRHPVANRDAALRKDYGIQLKINDRNPEGKIPINISVAEEHRKVIASSRFEVAIFVDGLFHYENEVAFLPMTYALDTAKLSPGEHYITVNIVSYDGNYGFATQKLSVGN